MVTQAAGSVFDDHTTAAGQCRRCGAWLVLTTFHTGRVESRPMTPAELDRAQAIEDSYRRSDAS